MTPFQEGQAQARRELFPPPSSGYRRGRAEHTAFVDIGLVVCEVCGAVVGDTDLHTEWHAAEGAVARAAHRSDVMTRPIGGST